jgi:hypothetical protein
MHALVPDQKDMSSPVATQLPSGAAVNLSVFTLCEPKYFVGAAALLNSLISAGFHGAFIVGIKGKPAGWLSPPPSVSPHIRVRVVEIEGDRHLAQMKALFARRVLEELEPGCDGVIYLDPDIVLKAKWADFASRAISACCVCADENPPLWVSDLPPWVNFVREVTGQELVLEGPCINSGFFSVPRSHRRVLEVWEQLISACISRGFDPRSFTWNGERALPFFFVDQDMLNLAIRLAGTPVWIGGPETMDFIPGGNWLSHAISTPKPWDRWYLPRVLAGRKVRRCDIAFWQHAGGPIPAVPAVARGLHRLDLAIARRIKREPA